MSKSEFLKQDRVFRFTLHVLMAMALLSTNLKSTCANAVTPEIPTMSDNENEFMMPADEKDEIGDLYYPSGKQFVTEDDFNADMMPFVVFFPKPATIQQLIESENEDMNDDNVPKQKRGWKKMNVAWGKRRNAGQYMNKGSVASSWGKREANWHKLKGMWGKRSINADMPDKLSTNSNRDNWNKFSNSWCRQFAGTN